MRDEFEKLVQDKISGHEVQAPDVFSQIVAKRTPLHIFKNKLFLNRYKILGAAAIIMAILLFVFPIDKKGLGEHGLDGNFITNTIPESTESADDNINIDSRNQDDIVQEDMDNASVQENPVVANIPSESANSNIENEIFERTESDKIKGDETSGDINSEFVEDNNADASDATATPGNEGIVNGNSGQAEDQNQVSPENPVVKSEDSGTGEDSDSEVSPFKEDIPSEEEVDGANDDAPSSESAEDIAQEINDDSDSDKSVEIANAEDVNTTSETAEPSINDDPDLQNLPIKKASVLISGGVSFAGRDLSNGSDLKALRNQSERNLMSFNFGAVLNYEISKNLEFFSGLEYSDRREEMRHQSTNKFMAEEVKTKRVKVIDPVEGEKWIDVDYKEWVEKTEVEQMASNNSYKRIVVPIGLRYNIYKNQFSFSPFVAGGIQVYQKYDGNILKSAKEMESLSHGSFGAEIGQIEAKLGLDAAYRLNQRLSIIVQPSVKYFLNPVNGPSYILRQRDKALDVDLGIKYNF